MRILDRYIVKSFLVNYLLALGVMVGMYVLLDLIVNVQDFARGATAVSDTGSSAWDIATDMLNYYFFQLPVIFQQVSGAIPTLAAGFTMMRMTRHHELTAMLASGVSLYRVAAPIILVSTVLASVQVMNQELLISQPYMIDKVMRKHNEVRQAYARGAQPLTFVRDSDGWLLSAGEYDPAGRAMTIVSIEHRDASGKVTDRIGAKRAEWAIPAGETSPAWVLHTVAQEDARTIAGAAGAAPVKTETLVYRSSLAPERLDLVLSKTEPLLFLKDADGSLLSATAYDPVDRTMQGVSVVYRDDSGRASRHKVAQTAEWMLPPGQPTEAWVMTNVIEQDDSHPEKAAEQETVHSQTEINRTSLTPDQLDLVLSRKAVDYLSSEKIWALAAASPDVNRPLLYKIMHLRFTQPLMNIVMLLIGVPFLLTREPNRLVKNMGICTVVSGAVFIATFVIFQMGGTQLDPLLAAWLPVLIFGPLALVMMDTIKT